MWCWSNCNCICAFTLTPLCIFPQFFCSYRPYKSVSSFLFFLLQLGCVTLCLLPQLPAQSVSFLSPLEKNLDKVQLLFIVKMWSAPQSTELLKAIILHWRSPCWLIWLNTLSHFFGFLQAQQLLLLLLQLLLQFQLSPVPQLLVLVHKVVGGELGPADLAGEILHVEVLHHQQHLVLLIALGPPLLGRCGAACASGGSSAT